MTIMVGLSDAKAKLSELANRVAYGGDRVIVTKHGKPFFEITPPRATEEEPERDPNDWVWQIAGAFADDPEYCDIVDQIVADRVNWMPKDSGEYEDDLHETPARHQRADRDDARSAAKPRHTHKPVASG